MAGMVRTAGLARMAGTAQTARTAWTVRTGWKIGQLGNCQIGKLGVFKVGGNGTRMDAFPGLQKKSFEISKFGFKIPESIGKLKKERNGRKNM